MSSLAQSLANSLADSLSISLASSIPFTTEWTVAGDAAARTITLPLVQNRAEGALSYNCVVNWGDGTTPSFVTSYNDANRIHTYASDGTYIVKIYGVMEGWSFNNGGDKDKIVAVINWGSSPTFEGFKYLRGGFYGCTNLTSIGIGSIPASGTGILSDGFRWLFRNTGLLVIPSARLFDKHPLAVDMGHIFYQCPITSIPSGLFDKLINATNFTWAFFGTNLASIPDGLFDYTVSVTDLSYVFRNTNITTVPEGLFDHVPSVTTFLSIFYGCSNLETTPSELFRFNTSCLNFSLSFYGCIKHQENIDLFYQAGEESTRFLNQDVDFTSCFERASFSGTQGTAPDLWNCSFGTGTPTTTNCWAGAGNSASSLTNYASIPAGWK